MSLDAAPFMQQAFRFQVRLVSFFGCFEGANGLALAARKGNLRQPLSWACLARGLERHAKKARLVVALRSALVLFVYRGGNAAQVAPTVVSPVPVDVINLAGWPFSVHIEPRKAVGVVLAGPVHANVDVPVGCLATGQRAHGRPLAPNAPAELALDGVVGKKLAQTLRAKIWLSHEALQLLIGQRPRRVSSTTRPRYFGLYGNTVQALENPCR